MFIQREIHVVFIDVANLRDWDGDILTIPEMPFTQDDMGNAIVHWADHKLFHLANMPIVAWPREPR